MSAIDFQENPTPNIFLTSHVNVASVAPSWSGMYGVGTLGWFIGAIDIEDVWFIGIYGGAAIIKPEDYYAVTL